MRITYGLHTGRIAAAEHFPGTIREPANGQCIPVRTFLKGI